MPREIELFGLLLPTLLPLFVGCILLQWVLDNVLSRLGLYPGIWHPALLRLSLFVCLFGLLGLAVYG